MNIFNNIALSRPKRNKFDLSHEKKLSMNMGDLVPILVEEIVPGDKFRVSSEIMIRFAPMLAPVMHRINVYTHYFFVPNRLVNTGWEEFITGGEDGTSVVNHPKINISQLTRTMFAKGSLADYIGIPPIEESDIIYDTFPVSALPFRAYQLIYNEYYRDQNLTEKVTWDNSENDNDNTDAAALTQMRKRAWEKDYFTSALPWAQRGGEVLLPVDSEYTPQYRANSTVVTPTGIVAAGDLTHNASGQIVAEGETGYVDNLEATQNIDSTSVTINQLRVAVRLQEWLEKNARAGSRYVEQILSHFGVKSSDARLQRPEYLGGGKNPVVISEVLNTTGTAENPQGNMSGHGISVGKTNRFQRSFEEHGFVIGIMSVLPKTTYQQGFHKSLLRTDKYDYYWPEFARLGEQEVLNKELFVNYNNSEQGNETFGYQKRYGEYKFKSSSVHGDFRDELAYWQMGRIFPSTPMLNTSFVESDPTHRIFAVTDPSTDKLYVQIYNSVQALRPMPFFGTPTL